MIEKFEYCTFLNFMEKEIIELNKKIEFLIKDDRTDESDLEKIKLNVFCIFKQVYESTYKRFCLSKDNLSSFFTNYKNFFEKIPQNWYESLEKAKKHKNYEKIFVEEIKIETMLKIKNFFLNYIKGIEKIWLKNLWKFLNV